MNYQPVLTVPALRVVARLSPKRADKLVDTLCKLTIVAESESVLRGYDITGRPIRFIVLDHVGITFWVDHAVGHLLILKLEFRR
ncbi:MAG: hypothetical protein WC661_13600 [Opitutaceae bacterium]